MSNIFTDFVRIYPLRDAISEDEAANILEGILGERGSYHIPVVCHRVDDGDFLDIQYGSGKSGFELMRFCEEAEDRYDIWGRHRDGGSGEPDEIWHRYPWEPLWLRTLSRSMNHWTRPCRYGFDEVRVTLDGDRRIADVLPAIVAERRWERVGDGWRTCVDGSYLTSNDRVVIDDRIGPRARQPVSPGWAARPGGLATPSTPAYRGGPLISLAPGWLRPLGGADCPAPGVDRVDFRWCGRVVHRAEWGRGEDWLRMEWRNLGADHWDNCLDEDYAREWGWLQR